MRTMVVLSCIFVCLSVANADEPAPSADLIAATIVASAAAPVDARPLAEASNFKKVVLYRLRNVAAADAAKSLNDALQPMLKSSPHVSGIVANSPVVVAPEPVTNSLIVIAEPPYADKVAAIVKDLDVQRRQIRIQASILFVGPDGERKLLSRPQIITLDGQLATVSVDGAELGTIEVELTPHAIEPDVEEAEMRD